MTRYFTWSDIRAEFVAQAGGEEAIAEARRQSQAYIDAYRPAEQRIAQGQDVTVGDEASEPPVIRPEVEAA
ncbi:hypothetical protein L3i22_099970 [Actinoplanes sp. L3-i22]|nr:hypothetical protein L3i22_099970 [Actinoplanes sp. L3-i22]